MAGNFPAYIHEENWETGTSVGGWDSETDTGSRLNVVHYATLAKYDSVGIGPIAPWRGAFCIEINCGDTNDHTLIKATTDVIADAKIGWTQFLLFIGNDFRATADDVFSILELQGTANSQEVTVALKITAATGAVQIAAAQAQADIVFTSLPTLPRGRWICVEVVNLIAVGAATGTTQVFIDGTAQSAAVTNAAVNTPVLRSVLGTQDTLSTTLGHLFIDGFKFDTNTQHASGSRIGMPHDRYPTNVLVTKSTHLCLGTSDITNVQLVGGSGTDSVLKIYDTDSADVQDDTNVVAILNGTAAAGVTDLANVPVTVKRGAFVQLSGTASSTVAPFALISIGTSQGWGSHGRIRQHGFKRAINLNPMTQ